MRFFLVLMLSLGLGCSDNGDEPGTGPNPGCTPEEPSCMNGPIDPTIPCCELATPPDVADACAGDESLENPTSCTETGTVVTHQLTLFEVLGDCNEGYDLDDCAGSTCEAGGLAPGDGIDGVDNAVAGLAPVLAAIEANLDGLNQAFSDAFCGIGGEECAEDRAIYDLELAVDANLEEGCANVDVLFDDEEAGSAILNVSAPNGEGHVCASGTLGTVPFKISGVDGSVAQGNLSNAVLRVTIAPTEGFAHGRLGVTVDGNSAVAIANALVTDGGAIIAQVFDIKNDLSAGGFCDAVSGTFTIGGVVTQ